MLSTYRIQRLFDGHRYEAILAGLEANGMILPLPLRVRLAGSPVAAVALGLRRLLELTYQPTPLADDMLAFLLDAQGEDGSFADDPLATAAAAAALQRARREGHVAPAELAEPAGPAEGLDTPAAEAISTGGPADYTRGRATATLAAQSGTRAVEREAATADRHLSRAIVRALGALAAWQDDDGLFHAEPDRPHAQRALTAAFIAYLLSADESFCRTVRFADLMTALEEAHHAADLETRTLIDLARLQTPDQIPTGGQAAMTRAA